MIYPQKLNNRKREIIFKICIIFSIFLALILKLINHFVAPNFPWAELANCGILYIWVVVIYSIKRSTNIAGHILVQMLAISAVSLYVDNTTIGNGWSVYIAIPIIIMISNISMLIMNIIFNKSFIRYAIYQLIIFLISLIPIILSLNKVIELKLLIIIATTSSFISLSFGLVLCFKDVKEAIKMKLHM